MKKQLMLCVATFATFAASQVHASCPFNFQALPRQLVVITSSDELAPQCNNVYQALGSSNPCELDGPSRWNIASNFYRASREYRQMRNIQDCDGTGPKTSKVMSCLLSSGDEYAFGNCLGIER